jgi:hypothetical protein
MNAKTTTGHLLYTGDEDSRKEGFQQRKLPRLSHVPADKRESFIRGSFTPLTFGERDQLQFQRIPTESAPGSSHRVESKLHFTSCSIRFLWSKLCWPVSDPAPRLEQNESAASWLSFLSLPVPEKDHDPSPEAELCLTSQEDIPGEYVTADIESPEEHSSASNPGSSIASIQC